MVYNATDFKMIVAVLYQWTKDMRNYIIKCIGYL